MKNARTLSIVGMVVGALLTLGPILGLLGTVYGMNQSFHALGANGIGDPRALSRGVALTLLATVAGLVASPVGIILLIFSAFRYSKARRAGAPPVSPPGPQR